MTIKPPLDNFYSAQQVAEALGVSKQTVIRWIKNGDVKALQLPRKGAWRIPINEYNKIISSQGSS